ncbi:helix-turn-helix transcriptional regulator [Anaerocolumna sp. AGMB13020]|uniref:helix-turn-helix domain-containing protein n=1 Tax=Anaerocolumna sp. AGMB13020 TaxID=3081750 RepID=UPI0029532140|nr:helix-turn-helix transcriptional regulator [Anaerocolumna sp. AGMB13020]WOO35026.1 helix-turn-helix transcriptional regulator [Anaerocolumna sp. AGMB13020]
MSDNDLKHVFSNNLRFYTQLRRKNFSELAESIGVGKSSVSNWLNGISMPRMDKIDLICNELDITRSQLLDISKSQSIDDELTKAFGSTTPNATEKEIIKELIQLDTEINTIAAHFDGNEYTEEELEEIKKFAEFVKLRRNK